MSDPIFTLTSTNPFGLRNVGSFASSTLIDIDGDRDLDVFVGKGDGNTAFFRNTGTVNSPIFAAPSTNPFGLSDVGDLASPTFVDIDGDGDLDAFVGNGGSGNDTLDGGLGVNKLTGGTGSDVFKFTTKGHIDTITDFNVTNDTIQLENAVFTSLTATGTLVASQFKLGTKALDANDFIIYNKATGALLYDADGNGGGAAVQITMVGAGLNMTNADIVVI